MTWNGRDWKSREEHIKTEPAAAALLLLLLFGHSLSRSTEVAVGQESQ